MSVIGMKSLAGDLINLFEALDEAVAASNGKNEKEDEVGLDLDLKSLQRLINNPDLSNAVFPVYGVVKAGKSTFMACLIGEKILPEQALPMTSIPIRIKHVITSGDDNEKKKLIIPQFEKWNECVHGVRQKLLAKTLKAEIASETAGVDGLLYRLQEQIRNDQVRFEEETTSSSDIRLQLDIISHFVRLLWNNDIDFEKDYEISMEVNCLPVVEMTMQAFEGSGGKSFTLLDTPGPNETKAMAALNSIGPNIMKSSSGVIFCIPWQQVEACQQDILYKLINTTMAGKRIVVIITQMDSWTDTDEAKVYLTNNIRAQFVESMRPNLTILLTSGHKMFVLKKLERSLKSHIESEPEEIYDAITESDFYGDLTKYLPKSFVSPELFSYERMMDFVSVELKVSNSKEVLDAFISLYTEAETIALLGHFATINNAHNRWKVELKKLKEFADASENDKIKIQDELIKMTNVYEAILSQLKLLPNEVESLVNTYLDVNIEQVLVEFANSMSTWRIITVDSCGNIIDNNPTTVEWLGGPADIRMWFRDTALPILQSYVTRPAKSCLEIARNDLPGKIKEKWQDCLNMCNGLSHYDNEVGLQEMAIFFTKVPEVEIDVDGYIKRAGTFDVSKITYDEIGDKCVITNNVFKVDVLNQFKEVMNQVSTSLKISILEGLKIVFENFTNLVEREAVSAKKIFERNQKLMENKIDQTVFLQMIEDMSKENDKFEEASDFLRAELNCQSGAKRMPPQ